MHSAWAIFIAFGTSGGFSPTSAENKSSSAAAGGAGAAGRPTGLTGVTGSGTRALLRASLPSAVLLPEPLGLGLAPSFESLPLAEEDVSLWEAFYARHFD